MSLPLEKEGIREKEHKNEEVYTKNFEFVAGLRRGGQLLYMMEEKQLFVYKVAWNEKRHFNRRVKKYICYEKTCKASVNFAEDDYICWRGKTAHSHESTQEDRRRNFDFINACKNAASNALACDSMQDIYNNILRNNIVEKPSLSYEKIRRTLYRLRKDSSTPKRSLPKECNFKSDVKSAKIEKNSIEDFQHVIINNSRLRQSDQNSIKTDEEMNIENFQHDTLNEHSLDMPVSEDNDQSNSYEDNEGLHQPMFEVNILDDKIQIKSILQNILCIQEKRLSIDRQRVRIEEKRLAIEEKRLAIEEKRLSLDAKFKKKY